MTDVALDFETIAREASGIEPVKPFTDRKEERVEANLRAVIRLHDNTEIACCIRDVSKSGARLGIPRGCVLPKAFMLMINGRDFIFEMRLAWQREPYAGVHIERIARLSAAFPPIGSVTPSAATSGRSNSDPRLGRFAATTAPAADRC